MSEREDIIALFRGIPKGAYVGSKSRARSMHELVDRISRTYKIESPRIEILIVQNWRKIVGEGKAHRCKPSKILKDHTLIITTMNTTLRMELQFEKEQILKNLQQLCGDDIIREVVIR